MKKPSVPVPAYVVEVETLSRMEALEQRIGYVVHRLDDMTGDGEWWIDHEFDGFSEKCTIGDLCITRRSIDFEKFKLPNELRVVYQGNTVFLKPQDGAVTTYLSGDWEREVERLQTELKVTEPPAHPSGLF
jgi:hypothetical protein